VKKLVHCGKSLTARIAKESARFAKVFEMIPSVFSTTPGVHCVKSLAARLAKESARFTKELKINPSVLCVIHCGLCGKKLKMLI